jgi:hypothetical protein
MVILVENKNGFGDFSKEFDYNVVQNDILTGTSVQTFRRQSVLTAIVFEPRWQCYGTHLHTNNTHKNTINAMKIYKEQITYIYI